MAKIKENEVLVNIPKERALIAKTSLVKIETEEGI